MGWFRAVVRSVAACRLIAVSVGPDLSTYVAQKGTCPRLKLLPPRLCGQRPEQEKLFCAWAWIATGQPTYYAQSHAHHTHTGWCVSAMQNNTRTARFVWSANTVYRSTAIVVPRRGLVEWCGFVLLLHLLDFTFSRGSSCDGSASIAVSRSSVH
jgi:hypothetical protein